MGFCRSLRLAIHCRHFVLILPSPLEIPLQKEVEDILSPLVQKAYAASAGSSVPDESVPEAPETQEDNSSSNEPHIEEIERQIDAYRKNIEEK